MSGESGSVNVINLKLNLDNSSAPVTNRSLSSSSQEDGNIGSPQSMEAKLIGMVGEVQKQLSRLENKIDHNDQQMQTMSRNIENRDIRMEEKLKDNTSDFSSRLEHVLSQVNARNDLDELKEKYNHLQETLRQVREKLNKKDGRIRELLTELSNGKKKSEELNNIIQKCRAEIAEKSNVILEKDKAIEEIKTENQQTVERYKQEVKCLKDEVRKEEQKLKNYERKQQEMEEEMKQKDKDILDLEKEKIALKTENNLRREEADKVINAVKEIAEARGENTSDYMRIESSPDCREETKEGTLCNTLAIDVPEKQTTKSATLKPRESPDKNKCLERSRSYNLSTPERAFIGTKSVTSSQHKDFKPPMNQKVAQARKAMTERTSEKNKYQRK